jgi:hypothetical protein
MEEFPYCFHNKSSSSLMQVVFGETYWFRFCRLLQKELRADLPKVCHMEVAAMELLASSGWCFNAKLIAF